jgi:UDP-2,4-diacetamido-2,4,6-trideoxy-beta-L-altropyranose hydrolase
MNMLLRDVLPADSETLLRWRNDPETRHNSINTAEVSPDEHARWFRKMLACQPPRVRIAEIAGVSIGVVRLDWTDNNDSCEVSFTVAPEHRGKGCGFAIVQHAVEGIRNARVCAKVKSSNAASRRIFERLGYQMIDSQGELVIYAKDF